MPSHLRSPQPLTCSPVHGQQHFAVSKTPTSSFRHARPEKNSNLEHKFDINVEIRVFRNCCACALMVTLREKTCAERVDSTALSNLFR